MRHKDKVVIVTGAGRNIGEETAKLFVKEGLLGYSFFDVYEMVKVYSQTLANLVIK